AGRDVQNVKLAKALVDAYLSTGKYADAERVYGRLKAMHEAGKLGELNDQEYRELLEAGARVAFRSGRFKDAIDRFDEIYKTYTTDQKFVNEFAGVCIQGGDYDKAVKLLTSSPPDVAGRKPLIAAYMQQKEWGKALNEVNKLIVETKNDPESLRLKADIEG